MKNFTINLKPYEKLYNFASQLICMNKKLLIRDVTLRDGQQSLLATRMNQQQTDLLLPYFKEAGFYALEVWGGAVPDSVMRYLKENPWHRLEKIKSVIGNSSKLTALSRGRNLFGYNPYPEEVIEGFNRNAVQSGIDIMRVFDALNDLENIGSTIRYVKKNGGIADGTLCYTVDPKPAKDHNILRRLSKTRKHKPVFTTEYFVNKAIEIEKLGADIITIKDMAGLITPSVSARLIREIKKAVSVPVDFHTHCTPGYGLASLLAAIINGVDIADTNLMTFAGGPAAPAYEIIHIFCKKLGIETGVNIEVLFELNEKLAEVRKELKQFDGYSEFPRPFDLCKDVLPRNIEKLFDDTITYLQKDDEKKALIAAHSIETYFRFPAPDEKVRMAEIPGGMYTNMLAQLEQLKLGHMLPKVLETVPEVRLMAGCPPLVTPTSQIVGVQAVNCLLDENKGLPRYTNNSIQFVNLVKGSYGKTPIPVNPEFRKKITGHADERPYDTSSYRKHANPELPEFGNRKLANNEKDELLLELFPSVAENYLKGLVEAEYNAEQELVRLAKEEEMRKQEEAMQKEKQEYDKLSPEEKKKRLVQGLYHYRWTSTGNPDDGEIDRLIFSEN